MHLRVSFFSVASIAGSGSVSFLNSQFVDWDEQTGDGRAALRTESPNATLILNGNTFHADKAQVDVSRGAKKLVFTSNVCEGTQRIKGSATTSHVVANNAFE